jgi:leukotriene-A4 hydrolase
MNNSYSSLTPQLGFDNPDNAFSEVPYEKGYFFLQYLSSVIGNENMIKFLNIYTVTFKFQSIGVQDFLDLFERYCATEGFDISEVNWD